MKGQWLRKPIEDTTVVFVHGFLSDTRRAWQNNAGDSWPSLLRGDTACPNVGIYVFDYHTSAFAGAYSLSDIVTALKEQLRHDGLYKSRHLIFVCHSMGGIVVRKFIVDRQLDILSAKLKIDVFLVASPSLGSSYANLFSKLASILNNSQLTHLRAGADNYWLTDLDSNFRDLYQRRLAKPYDPFSIEIFGKELIEDKFIVLKNVLQDQVVSAFSGSVYFPNSVKIPNSDHFSIAAPEDRSAMQYWLLTEFIGDQASAAKPKAVSTRDDNGDQGIVKLISDASDPDLFLALHLYEDRIPESERFESSDIIRWIREDLETREASRMGPRDFFLLEKFRGKVRGCALIHYYPQTQFAFFAYMVTDKGLNADAEAVSHSLAKRLRELCDSDKELREFSAILLEVDDPRNGRDEDERRERLARMRLFDTLASAMGFVLRVIYFHYKQPYVSLAEAEADNGNVQMLILEMTRKVNSLSEAKCLSQEQMKERLKFIYLYLYPEGFSDCAEDNIRYRSYLNSLLNREITNIGSETKLLSVREFRDTL